MRDWLETHQVAIYFVAVALAGMTAILIPSTIALEFVINPALAFMLFVTFLQVPVADLGRTFASVGFVGPLLTANFVAIPLLVGALVPLLPDDPLIRLGALLVLLTPCIDYVVTFAHMGKGDAKRILAATPLLLLAQVILLPIYLTLFLGNEAAALVHVGPFIHAFVWLIAVPLALAGLLQFWAVRSQSGRKAVGALGLMPVPATAFVLFVVIASVVPQLSYAQSAVMSVAPVYLAFATIAPIVGWLVARVFKLEATAGRAVAFSAATRNSLVVLPLAFAVPGAVPVLPAVIVTQTLIELISELIYIRVISRFGAAPTAQA
jgi:arsenite transporter